MQAGCCFGLGALGSPVRPSTITRTLCSRCWDRRTTTTASRWRWWKNTHTIPRPDRWPGTRTSSACSRRPLWHRAAALADRAEDGWHGAARSRTPYNSRNRRKMAARFGGRPVTLREYALLGSCSAGPASRGAWRSNVRTCSALRRDNREEITRAGSIHASRHTGREVAGDMSFPRNVCAGPLCVCAHTPTHTHALMHTRSQSRTLTTQTGTINDPPSLLSPFLDPPPPSFLSL